VPTTQPVSGHPKENEPADPDNYKQVGDDSFTTETKRLLTHRFPSLVNSEVIHSWAGLYTITPDWNMIVDRSEVHKGHYLAVGGSGHSFKLAPAIGLCLAEMIIEGRSSTVDISALQAKRFSQNDMLRSTYGGNRA